MPHAASTPEGLSGPKGPLVDSPPDHDTESSLGSQIRENVLESYREVVPLGGCRGCGEMERKGERLMAGGPS